MEHSVDILKSCLGLLKDEKTKQNYTNPVCEKFSIRPLEGMTNDGYYVGVSEPN